MVGIAAAEPSSQPVAQYREGLVAPAGHDEGQLGNNTTVDAKTPVAVVPVG
jgi:hypothetical protein